MRNPAVAVRVNPVPLPERRGAQPVGVVYPIGPAGGVVERLQRFPVRRLAARIVDRHHGRVRRTAGDSGRQRTTEPERDRFGRFVVRVCDSRDDEGPRAGGSRDGDAIRHPRIVLLGRPAAQSHRQGDCHRQGRTVGLIDQAHSHFDAPALSHHVARRGKSNPQRSVAGEPRGTEIGNRGQPCLNGGIRWHAYAGVRDNQRREFRQLHQVPWDLADQFVALQI